VSDTHRPIMLRDLMDAVGKYEGEVVGYNLSVLVHEPDGVTRVHHWCSGDRWSVLGLLWERMHSLAHGEGEDG
jgi:hypothetical protein